MVGLIFSSSAIQQTLFLKQFNPFLSPNVLERLGVKDCNLMQVSGELRSCWGVLIKRLKNTLLVATSSSFRTLTSVGISTDSREIAVHGVSHVTVSSN